MLKFNLIDFDFAKQKFEKDMQRIEMQKICSEFFKNKAETKGHQKITMRIELDLHDFLYSKGIKEDFISYKNLDTQKNGKTIYYKRDLRIKYQGTITYIHLTDTDKLENLAYYDTILNNEDVNLSKIKEREKKLRDSYNLLVLKGEKYNTDLQNLSEFQEKIERYLEQN